ncbi:MAG: 2-dehydropantoate 2-reductase [Methanotrichaceae archaeon]|nr:2-dehydropantoate 2-reductase [Methanotrichaceae archaeon]
MTVGRTPRYLVFGAGAIGSVLGGFLQEIGCDVTYTGRGVHFKAMQEKGLKITGIWGEHYIPAGQIKGFSYDGSGGEKYSVILLCVKSTATKDAAQEASAMLDKDGIMVSMQNGLKNWETIAGYAGERRTVGGRVIFGSEIPTPGTARVTVNADDVLLGEPFVAVNRRLLAVLNYDLQRAGIPVRTVSSEEIHAALWMKVLYNSALNPLSAILEVPYGRLGERSETRQIMSNVMKEIFSVIHQKGVKVPFGSYEDYYNFFMEKLLPPTVDHRSSMLQDIMNGRQTEIDALNGAISEYGREMGIETPYNDMLTALIKFKEKRPYRF